MVEVTRSLSNLLKGFYIAVDKSDKRVIDSNELISEKLIHIRNTVNNEGFSSEGFCAGLNPVNVSEMLDYILKEYKQAFGDTKSNRIKKMILFRIKQNFKHYLKNSTH